MPLSQIPHVEAGIKGLSKRAPGLPVLESMICRVALILGRDLNTCIDRLLKHSGLAEPEYRVLLALLGRDGEATPSELCAALAQSPANLTRIADALVVRGLIARKLHAEDRRKMLLSLRPAGEVLVSGLLPDMSAEVSAAFREFSAAEKKRLLGDMKKLIGGIDNLNAARAHNQDQVA
jgi:MarR family transcriptional regulator, negative regulator of the multidrug operon emrRAB